MEELAKALAEAVRAGKDITPMALLGYYAVRIIEALATPAGFVCAALIAGQTIRRCVLRYAEVDEQRASAGQRRRTADPGYD